VPASHRSFSESELLTIGSVLTQLRDEFPEISISKIRFLESSGLVTPTRTASGYRKFSLVDVEHLRYILRMQRDYFLPLRVIKEHIDAISRGLEPPAVVETAPRPPRNLVSADTIDAKVTATVRLTRDELAESAGVEAGLIDSLVEFGLLSSDASGYFSVHAMAIVGTARALHEFGLEPRHLKTVMSSASREVELFAPILKSARKGSSTSHAETDEIKLQLANGIVRLHQLFVRDLTEHLN